MAPLIPLTTGGRVPPSFKIYTMAHTTKWVVFNPSTFQKVKTVTIKHESNLLYRELDPFEKKLKNDGLAAHDYNSLNQDYLKGKSFREKLKCLGW